MFVDEVKIKVAAGKGGDGCVSFVRSKYVPKGGPDGGNGGKGGDIIFHTATNIHTLADFRSEKNFKAENGKPGGRNNRTGGYGQSLILQVPVGTQIRDSHTQEILVDLVDIDQEFVIAKGGRGGKGNAGFVSSVRQAPNFAEKGDIGEEFEVDLELKLVADVAIVGLPNVGKSTFISVVSNAKPKIADYEFTTIIPHLGVSRLDDKELVFIDVPGLIKGAHQGKGLGHQFLRHIERAKFVLHLIDATSNTPLKDFEVIREELEKFSPDLAKKPFLPVFTKIDLTDGELEDFLIAEFKQKFGLQAYKLSAPTHEGLDELMGVLWSQVPKEKKKKKEEVEEDTAEEVVFRPAEELKKKEIEISKTEFWWEIKNERLEQMVRQTDPDSEPARERIYDVLKKKNLIKKLEKQGAVLGDKIRIGEQFWEMRE
ncbi:GTPase ObgE [Candidatus Gracilibacteria bacterium]|nr:GTPase ObgE [Candidatus Gracilibacteria bacterium]